MRSPIIGPRAARRKQIDAWHWLDDRDRKPPLNFWRRSGQQRPRPVLAGARWRRPEEQAMEAQRSQRPWVPLFAGAAGSSGGEAGADDAGGGGAAGAAAADSADAAAGTATASHRDAGDADRGLTARIFEALDEIAAALEAPANGGARLEGKMERPTSLADGPGGEALFFHYLDQARPGQGHDDRAVEKLESAIAATAEQVGSPGLYSGFSGIAWALEHLTGRLLEAPATGEEDPGLEVATVLEDYLRQSPWQDEYDLIGGLAGYGVWAVERSPRPGGPESAENVVRRLGELAVRRDGGVTWHTAPERLLASETEKYPNGYYNVGVAHGVPGVIGILGEIHAAGLGGGECRELLDGAVAWLLRQGLPPGASSHFSYTVAPDAEPTPARLAWCYGDLGVAVCLLLAARAAGEAEWERQALDIARAAARRPTEGCGVIDGGLCHGAAGLAHLYNRLFQASRDPIFREASRSWIEWLLEQRKPGQGTAGWLAWRPIAPFDPNKAPQLDWAPDAGLLTGATGIGLALLAAVSPVEPAWDRLLLASVPPRSAVTDSLLELRSHQSPVAASAVRAARREGRP
jgi:hypothetical protein